MLNYIKTTSPISCRKSETSKKKTEYLVVPMSSEGIESFLSTAEIYQINQILSSKQPVNYITSNPTYRRQNLETQPKYLTHPYPFVMNKANLHYTIPRNNLRNTGNHMRSPQRKPNPFSIQYELKDPVIIRPAPEQETIMLSDYLTNNQGKHSPIYFHNNCSFIYIFKLIFLHISY